MDSVELGSTETHDALVKKNWFDEFVCISVCILKASILTEYYSRAKQHPECCLAQLCPSEGLLNLFRKGSKIVLGHNEN